ncbi:hypothetical protein GGR26_002568 [Lewinella marina]|uniref:eCIS core domain-containing protein n=1 Tax=Neolewinella marina TaxID=438751 RepID=A0A2G0CB95_9BACT|nr:DUF4157 domain-containing protein [Neolewinella marina]NJB86791.1 hypothetical protein [Neolewinella marina]PHK97197.1 hypothetical protein CGL56_17300 [Neolewinella marina]
MSFKATRQSRRLRIPRPESQEGDQPFFKPLAAAPPVQTKLTVGAPDDRYEREADTVANRVVSGGKQNEAPAIQSMADSRMEEDRAIQEKRDQGAGPRVQRSSLKEEEPVQQPPIQQSAVEEEEPLQRMDTEEEEPLQTKRTAASAAPRGLGARLRGRAGTGRPLDGAVQQQMEAGFGRDFSNVNVHTDAAADEMNRELGARAFARGNDVYFRSGEYNPDTAQGQRLLAHELTHTVQQGGEVAVPRKPAPAAAVPIRSNRTGTSVQRQAVAFPWEGVIDTRWNAALRSTAANGPGNFVTSLNRNTRVTVTGNTNGWLAVSTTIDGSVVAGFVHRRLVSPIPAAGTLSPANADSRREPTAFGTYNVYPNAATGLAAGTNDVYEAEFQRLQTAWNHVTNSTGGIRINGTPADVADMISLIGREMGRSQTFRNLIQEITADAARPVTINAGRNNASWIDSFATNNVDLNDTEVLDDAPRPGYEWATSQGEMTTHWLTERRHAAVHGGGFGPAHAEPLAAGGTQQQYRRDLGAPGRIVSQVRNNQTDAAGNYAGLHQGEYTDDAGNLQIIRRDDSGGDPVPYEIEYAPAAPTAAAPGVTRHNRLHLRLTSSAAGGDDHYLKIRSAGGATVTTATHFTNAGAPLVQSERLGNLVPTGANISITIIKDPGFWSDEQIGTLLWAHPFDSDSLSVVHDGVTYRLTVGLHMDP